jgi:hypothetical protein
MKKSFFLPFSFCGLCLLSACGGGDSGLSSPPPAPATHFSVTAPPAPTAGMAVTLTVTALDASNDTVTTYSGTVRFTSTDVQAALPASSMLTNGAGNFSATLQTAGSQTITATDTVKTSIAGTSPSINVSPGLPTHFAVSAPTTVQSGTAFNLTVTALDAENNVAKSYTSAVHFSSGDAQSMLPANSTLTDGTGTFSATLRTAGGQSITATDAVTASITGTASLINVSAGPATHLSDSAPTTTQSGMAFNFTVTALDAANNVATGYGGTVHFTSTDGQAALPADSTLTNGAGNFSATLQTAGSQTVTATDRIVASITGTSSSITVGAMAPPIRFSLSAPTTAQSGMALNFIVTALDAANNVATGYGGTVHFTSTDGQAALPANSTLTNGARDFSATLQTAGGQSITATDTITASIAGTSPSIDVSPGPPTHFYVSAPTSVRAATPFSFIVTSRDAANNLASSYTGTVQFTSTDTAAVLPANSTLSTGMGPFSATLRTTGSQSITATDTVTSSFTGTSGSIEVFVNCLIKGEQCNYNLACCPGLRCGPVGNRDFCE